ncbi:MAG: glutathione-disulfide reductase [Burkholderiales bacterium]|nr:glutathione-disulfide reductase [Burkholderiales bacterium]MCW5605303.1 glutathione-disulfide reductase [Burkholderiales bacterium]
MPRYDYDLITIGGGSGGVRASRVAASLGARVALVETAALGGTCVNAGCIPKKLFSYAAGFASDFGDAAGYGWQVPGPRFDWKALRIAKDREISRLNGVYAKLLGDAGVQVVEGRAMIRDAHAVEVAGRRLSAEHLLVATGGRAVRPDIPGAELGITSDEAFHLEALPCRALLVGGGYIAVEFASIFSGLGVETTLVHRGSRLLRGFDEDIADVLSGELRRQGVTLLLDESPARVAREGGALRVTLASGRELASDLLMFATGRRPNIKGLGLEAAGVAVAKNGAVQVDDRYRSAVPSVHAVGDVIGRVQLTPVALAEGAALARTLFGGQPSTVDYANIPTAIFSHPHVGTVGLAEDEARRRFPEVKVYRSSFRPLKATLSGDAGKVFIKLVVDAASDRVLGAHMVGAEAGEIIQGLAVAMNCGATKAQFDTTIGIHPTTAEEFVTLRG